MTLNEFRAIIWEGEYPCVPWPYLLTNIFAIMLYEQASLVIRLARYPAFFISGWLSGFIRRFSEEKIYFTI